MHEERKALIEKVAKMIGFPFSERELSPNLRKRIGELAQKQCNLQLLHDKRIELERTPDTKVMLAIIFVVFGVMAFFWGLIEYLINKVFGIVTIIISLVLFISAIFLRKTSGVKDRRLKSLDVDISHLSSELEKDITSFSSLVFNELSKIHEAKLRPTVRHVMLNFAEILKAIEGKGIVLETVECPHCGAPLTLPRTGESCQCSHCNKTILAIDIFKKIKDIIS